MSKKYTGLASIGTLQRWIRTTLGRRGIRAVFKEGIRTAYATRDSVVIPRLTSAMTTDDEALLRFQICHEADGHHHEGPGIFDIIEENNIDMRKPLGAILNITEDQRIERAASKAYVGNAAVISNGREVTGRRSLEFLKSLSLTHAEVGLTDDTLKMQAVYLNALISQSKWCVGAGFHLRDEISFTYTNYPDISKYFDLLHDADYVTSILNLKSEAESFDLAKKIYGLLWDKTPDEVEQEIKEGKDDSQGEGEQEKSTSGTPESDESELTSDSDGGDGKDTEQVGRVDPRTGKYQLPFEYFVKSNHTQRDEGVGHGLGLDYSAHTVRSDFTPCPFEQFIVRDYKHTPPFKTGRLATFGGTFQQLDTSSAFANKMRRFLQVKAAVKYESGRKSGIVNSRALYRAGIPVVGDGDWNRRVFRKKVDSDILDVAASIVCDVSGSMSGPKVVHACHASMMLNHVINNVLRVNTEILTFTQLDNPDMCIIKSFGERIASEEIYARFDDAAHRMWGNDDADSILWAYDRLLRQRNKRKLMVVLSDGSPADGYDNSDPFYALKTTVKSIEDAGLATIIGIGIMDPAVRSFYKEHTIIDNADQLEDCLLQIINKQILNKE